ncbi:MAG TPA: CAP domain-containing protein [Deinococcales bacterium]|nr:CAP domain-containing protein [Deinococcales bacterium]
MPSRAVRTLAAAALTTASANAVAATIEGQALALINQARASGIRCPGGGGGTRLAALRLEPRLSAAALAHARDMGERNYLSHTGSGGSTARGRVVLAGYQPVRMSEIIYKHSLVGHRPESPVNWWLQSPVHCRAIMNPHYSSIGIGYWARGRSWTAVLASSN